ncbi:hypothetical protein [Kitasatospora sp. NPDC091207]|uniref:hypothetical protein n=1 Tax=Kitasatospora sp. NPDC091207 TaxID=3364083 RepID=UPI0037F10797
MFGGHDLDHRPATAVSRVRGTAERNVEVAFGFDACGRPTLYQYRVLAEPHSRSVIDVHHRAEGLRGRLVSLLDVPRHRAALENAVRAGGSDAVYLVHP